MSPKTASLREIREIFRQQLIDLPEPEAGALFKIAACHILQIKPHEISILLSSKLNALQIDSFNQILRRLQNHEPIQYIVGYTEFLGRKFMVNHNVLIPRPETEELVLWAIDKLKEKQHPAILDLGTGSGCIAVSLAAEISDSEIFALDLSEKAITTAINNAEMNQVKVNFFQDDILQTNAQKWPHGLDLIISNPPYIREAERAEMAKNVLDYEPSAALFVSNQQPLVFYEKITELAIKKLKSNGLLMFEINESLGNETAQLIKNSGFSDIEIRQDIHKKERMICALKP